jgi:hypothetical protein
LFSLTAFAPSRWRCKGKSDGLSHAGSRAGTAIEARRALAAELRGLADLLDSQEPDYLALHDVWEVLLDLAERAENLRVQFFSRHP